MAVFESDAEKLNKEEAEKTRESRKAAKEAVHKRFRKEYYSDYGLIFMLTGPIESTYNVIAYERFEYDSRCYEVVFDMSYLYDLKCTLIHELADVFYGGHESSLVSECEFYTCSVSCFDHLKAFFHRSCQRLFAEYMLTVSDGFHCHFVVETIRCTDVHSLDICICAKLPVVGVQLYIFQMEHLYSAFHRFSIYVAQCGYFRVLSVGQIGDMLQLPDPSTSDHSAFQFHYATSLSKYVCFISNKLADGSSEGIYSNPMYLSYPAASSSFRM